MELHKEPKLAEYTMKLEQENKQLKNLLNKANYEIDRLVARRIEARNDTCEWLLTDDGWRDCDGEFHDTPSRFCPCCGGRVKEITTNDFYADAYALHVESEIDWRREQEVGV